MWTSGKDKENFLAMHDVEHHLDAPVVYPNEVVLEARFCPVFAQNNLHCAVDCVGFVAVLQTQHILLGVLFSFPKECAVAFSKPCSHHNQTHLLNGRSDSG